MSKAAFSIAIFAGYMALMGAVLLLIPGLLLPWLGLSTQGEPWIRVLGFVLCSSAFYYFQAARLEFEPFFRWTVLTRGLVPFVILALVGVGVVPPLFLGFGIVDASGGLWTWLALRAAHQPARGATRA